MSLNYKEILEANLKSELNWYLEEFDKFFANKSSYSKHDVQLANELLKSLKNNLVEPCQINHLQHLLTFTIDKIGNKYPEFF